ncbi:MAG: amidohydrolase [Myxococcota bacterium]
MDRDARTGAQRWFRVALAGIFVAAAIPLIAIGVAIVALWLGSGPPRHDGSIVVYPAERILTMNPRQPTASAIAIADGRVLAIGTRSEVAAAIEGRPHEVDDRFADKVVLPGFIDPHIHASLALMFNLEIVSAMEWQKPSGPTVVVRGREAFLSRIAELAAAGDAEEWLLTWGYHEPYHGLVRRADLDHAAGERPVVLWQRSAHEMIFNSAALERLGFREADLEGPGADWEAGRLWEAGLFDRMDRIRGIFASPSRVLAALDTMSQVIHRGGLTTVGEQGFPQLSALAELPMLHYELQRGAGVYRWGLVPNAMYLMREHGDASAAERAAESLLRFSTDRVRIVRHVKYYADGAIFAQLMQMKDPYLDGHHGEWMMPPDEQKAVLEAFWPRGWTIHVHVNGDAGVDLVLDQFEAVRALHEPAPGQRLILEHYGYARPDQHERLRALGGEVSNNAYYAHELAPIYAEHGLGPERASDISPLGGLVRAGVPFSFHSDFPMAPAEPLRQAWVAVNRIGSDGEVWGPDQRVSLDLALRAITIEGARSLGLEDEIGSLEVGKRADLTVLEADPYETPPADLADIPIWGTVLGGKLHPIE